MPLNLQVRMRRERDLFISLMIIFLFAFFTGSNQEPFENVHWDAPIYLYHSKRFAETHLMKSYIAHSNEIAKQVKGGWFEDEDYSEPYWHFMRLGNIVLLGSISSWAGSDMQAIHLTTWVYRFFLAMSLVFSVLMSVRFIELISIDINKNYLVTAAVISSLLYVSSNVWVYMNGNLVSEIPALLFLSLSTLLFVQSVCFKSYVYAFLSGFFAFCLYFVRIESIWYYLTFVVSFLLALIAVDKKKIWWPALLVSGGVAFILFCNYAWLLYPLCDPRLIVSFSKTMIENKDDFLWRLQVFFTAGGFLWIGMALLIIFGRLNGKWVLFFLWFVLNIFPWVVQNSFPPEVRPIPIVYPSLLLISILGWVLFLEKNDKSHQGKLKTLFLFLVVLFWVSIGNSTTYRLWDAIPGGWRLGYVRNFTKIPPFQKNNYYIKELSDISRTIFNSDYPLLLWTSNLSQEELILIRYFGPSYTLDSDLSLIPSPSQYKSILDRKTNLEEPVVFCPGSIVSYLKKTPQEKRCALLLDTRSNTKENIVRIDEDVQELIHTEHFQLYEIQCRSKGKVFR